MNYLDKVQEIYKNEGFKEAFDYGLTVARKQMPILNEFSILIQPNRANKQILSSNYIAIYDEYGRVKHLRTKLSDIEKELFKEEKIITKYLNFL